MNARGGRNLDLQNMLELSAVLGEVSIGLTAIFMFCWLSLFPGNECFKYLSAVLFIFHGYAELKFSQACAEANVVYIGPLVSGYPRSFCLRPSLC